MVLVWAWFRKRAWPEREGMARRRALALKILTALAKVEDETSLHVGAAHQILCCLDGVDGLGAHLALFGAQAFALVAEYAGRGKQRVWPESWTFVSPACPPSGAPNRVYSHLLSFRVKPGGH